MKEVAETPREANFYCAIKFNFFSRKIFFFSFRADDLIVRRWD